MLCMSIVRAAKYKTYWKWATTSFCDDVKQSEKWEGLTLCQSYISKNKVRNAYAFHKIHFWMQCVIIVRAVKYQTYWKWATTGFYDGVKLSENWEGLSLSIMHLHSTNPLLNVVYEYCESAKYKLCLNLAITSFYDVFKQGEKWEGFSLSIMHLHATKSTFEWSVW